MIAKFMLISAFGTHLLGYTGQAPKSNNSIPKYLENIVVYKLLYRTTAGTKPTEKEGKNKQSVERSPLHLASP